MEYIQHVRVVAEVGVPADRKVHAASQLLLGGVLEVRVNVSVTVPMTCSHAAVPEEPGAAEQAEVVDDVEGPARGC